MNTASTNQSVGEWDRAAFFHRPFDIYSKMILRNIEQLEGIKVGSYNINNLRRWHGTNCSLWGKATRYHYNGHRRKWKYRSPTECKEDWVHGNIKKRPDTPICNVSCKGQRIQIPSLNSKPRCQMWLWNKGRELPCPKAHLPKWRPSSLIEAKD